MTKIVAHTPSRITHGPPLAATVAGTHSIRLSHPVCVDALLSHPGSDPTHASLDCGYDPLIPDAVKILAKMLDDGRRHLVSEKLRQLLLAGPHVRAQLVDPAQNRVQIVPLHSGQDGFQQCSLLAPAVHGAIG